MKVYIRLELDDGQFEKLLKKVGQSMEGLKDTPPKVVIYEGTEEADKIDVYPQILKVTDVRDREGKLISEGRVYPGENPFEIAIEP